MSISDDDLEGSIKEILNTLIWVSTSYILFSAFEFIGFVRVGELSSVDPIPSVTRRLEYSSNSNFEQDGIWIEVF